MGGGATGGDTRVWIKAQCVTEVRDQRCDRPLSHRYDAQDEAKKNAAELGMQVSPGEVLNKAEDIILL